MRNRSKSDGAVLFAGFVNVLVHAIVKQVIPVAPPWV
jgi:hypothetical protein